MSAERTLHPSVGSAQPLEAFFESAERLDPEAFEAEQGSGFLIVSAASVDKARSDNTRLLLASSDDEGAGGRTADVAVVVYALRTATAQSGHLVTIGRDPKHDLVIPDPSVSRFHAYVKRGDDGAFTVQDMASTNGTTVNGVNAPARGAGPPVAVKPGDTICFGQVQLTFTDSRALREFVLQTGG
jgi:hypothetical protein